MMIKLTRSSIFYVDGSSQMDEMWNDESISEKCNANCISIKLDASSDECNQFKQLCKFWIFTNASTPYDQISTSYLKF